MDMALTTEVTVSVSRTFNLGNYESVKIEASVRTSRSEADDTFEVLRNKALDEVASILQEAENDHVPKRSHRGPPPQD
jgi:hypothetical protein